VSDHEPSYYEIALTNRQVLIAFAILLVCLVAAFLSGVWVGRGDAPPQPARLAEEAAAPAGGEAEEEPLSFFSGGAGAADSGAGAAEPAIGSGAGTTLAEDLGESVAAGEAERPVAPQTVEPPPAATPRRTEPATRPAAPPAAESAPPGAGEVVIQVFSSHDREQAQKIVDRLVAGGRDAYLSPVEMDGRTMYRVRIGPFADRAQAQPVADDVRRRFRLETWITPR
jgi:cell division septation protein DedD